MNTTSYLKRRSKPSKPAMTPPILRSSSSSSFDESYFSKTYVPLSSLPTPPLSHSRTNSRQQSPDVCPPSDLDPDLLGPAIHLTNLIPSSTSLTTPSIPLVHAMLTRAALPLETLALAVCILDSLNARFALQWRSNCPLQILSLPPPFTSSNPNEGMEIQHVDSIHPEIIILGAMILAVKFLDDHQQSTREYADSWGKGMWSCEQINYTQRVLMENLGYRLLPLWDETIILEALEDMERAGRQYEPEIYDEDEDNENTWKQQEGYEEEVVLRPGKGEAVLGLGNQITPVETPLGENCKGTSCVSCETRDAFRNSGEETRLQFPNEGNTVEPFPAFIPSYGF